MKIIKNNKKNNKIKVSVLISTYNKEKFIRSDAEDEWKFSKEGSRKKSCLWLYYGKWAG